MVAMITDAQVTLIQLIFDRLSASQQGFSERLKFERPDRVARGKKKMKKEK